MFLPLTAPTVSMRQLSYVVTLPDPKIVGQYCKVGWVDAKGGSPCNEQIHKPG